MTKNSGCRGTFEVTIAVFGLVIASAAVIATVTTPEIRRALGLDPAPTRAFATVTPQPTTTPEAVGLDVGQVLTGHIAAGGINVYRIQPIHSGCILMRVNGQAGFDHILRVTDGAYLEIARSQGGFPGREASLAFMATTDQTYNAFVMGADPSASGSYSIESRLLGSSC